MAALEKKTSGQLQPTAPPARLAPPPPEEHAHAPNGPPRVVLRGIVEYAMDFTRDGDKSSPCLWVRTQKSWYRVGDLQGTVRPSPAYRRLFRPTLMRLEVATRVRRILAQALLDARVRADRQEAINSGARAQLKMIEDEQQRDKDAAVAAGTADGAATGQQAMEDDTSASAGGSSADVGGASAPSPVPATPTSPAPTDASQQPQDDSALEVPVHLEMKLSTADLLRKVEEDSAEAWRREKAEEQQRA